MSGALPAPLQNLVGKLAKLPGLGPKSAMRIASTLLKWPEAETRRFGEDIASLRDTLRLCSRCGALSATDPCRICADANRDQTVLCVIPEWDSMLALEEAGFYNGYYFVLGGLLAPLEKSGTSSIDLPGLNARLAEGKIEEIILALGSTIEGENTATYISQAVRGKFPSIRVSRLAQGMPLGSEVKYMDKETLRQSWKYRQQI